MASEIRVDKINSLSGVGTVTLSPTGVDIAGITTAATLRATTGIVTSLTAGSLTSLGAVSGTTGTFSGAISGTTGTFSGAASVGGDITATSTDAGTTGPTLKLFHNSASPADNDVVSRINFSGDDDAGNETEYARIDTTAIDVSNGTETGYINFHTKGLGSFNPILSLQGRSTASAPSVGSDATNGLIVDVYNTGNPYPRYVNLIAKGGGDTDSNLTFWTEAVGGAPTEKLRITKDGDLGINVTSPSAKLDVVDNSASGYIAEFRQGHTSNSGQIVIDSPTNSDSRPVLMDMTRAGTLQWSIGQGYNSSGGAFHLATSSLSAGVTGVKASFLAGGGLTFNGDTAASNALDDYEEGTFSPNFKAANASGNSNTTVQEAKYLKIGGLIFFTFYIDMNSHGDDTGGMAYIEGLPYTSAGRHFSVSIGYFNLLLQSQTIFTGTVQPSSNNILLRHATGAATALAGMDYSNAIGTTTELICSGTYSVV